MHTAACKEFYVNLTVSLSRKKEVATSMVRGVKIELDSITLASILGVPGETGICEYIKDVWKPSKYYNPLEITRKFANNELIIALRRVKSTEMKPFQRRRDDEIDAPAEHNQNEEVAEEEQNQEFDWEAVNDEEEIQGEEVEKEVEIQEGSGSDDKFYDAQVDVEAPADEVPTAPAFPASPADSSTAQKEKAPAGVDPSAPTGSIPHSVFVSLQAELERARENRIQEELDRAQAENA
ncbi:hypothetical protein Dimus_024571 [Dionaea muscipula]